MSTSWLAEDMEKGPITAVVTKIVTNIHSSSFSSRDNGLVSHLLLHVCKGPYLPSCLAAAEDHFMLCELQNGSMQSLALLSPMWMVVRMAGAGQPFCTIR
jgi:hypothetical protein